MLAFLRKFFYWLFSKGEVNRPDKDVIQRLQISIRVTAKCRYNAASRLQRQGKFAFFTTTILSLGLIFIPLMQNSGVQLAFSASVLNMVSIFLAVAVLVYSVVIGTARYELRAENLTECGDKLKDLNRSISKETAGEHDKVKILDKYQERYSDIVTDTENHSQRDYILATLEMRRDYSITGLNRARLHVTSLVATLLPYLLPIVMLLLEAIFISDMIGITKILSPYLVTAHTT
ncbi:MULTISPECIES: SLATT domain-containing protein [Pseudomonas]|uniref:SLATT domain-containing protein n=1 Tax=Pseudomonas TaxID=286 RepID=UPI002248C3B4|nr:SLATT domain-containing protein [Pseudomonas sp. DCB_BG]MCX2707474.1 SLATT domain-containing protein [Pseudomonas sp. DCB_BG]